MADETEIRTKDLLDAATEADLVAGNYIPLDCDVTKKLEVPTLLKVTAQNALAGNVAPAFDPARTSENTYKAGESVVYEGKIYTFKVDHYGAWASADVYLDDVKEISSRIASKRPLTPCNFCHGNVSITSNGWSRVNDYRARNRAYIDIDHPVHLEAGDVAFVDGSAFGDNVWDAYVGIKSGSTYTYKSWTKDCLVKATGPTDVIYLFRFSNETILSDDLLNTIASSVCISVKAPDVPAPVVIDDIFDLQLRKGTYDFYSTAMHYGTHASRLTTAEYHYVELKAGDVVAAPGCKLWLSYFGKNITFEPIVQVSNTGWQNDSYTIAEDGVYAFIVDGSSYQFGLEQLYIERSGLKVTFGKYLQGVADVPVDASLFHIGYNAKYYSNAIPQITTDAKRACTFPNRPVKVSNGDTIIVNLDSTTTDGVYLQFVNAATGATTERSWSFASYAVPADGYVHLLVKFKDATSAEDYPAIIKDAFKLKTLAAFLNLSMAAKDEKTIKLPVKSEMFYPKEGIAHRGFSSVAPENTLPAYRLAAQNGFKWVECDVQYTSDGVAVLCHDSTINRTSSGMGTLSSYTLAQLREFDFGSWKSADYAGTPIPTLEDFLMCCNRLGLNAVIDFSNTGMPSIVRLYAMFELIIKCGMSGRVMFLTTGIKRMVADLVSYGCDAVASVSYLSDNITDVASDSMLALKDYKKRGYAVSLSTDYSHITDDVKNFCKENDIPLNAYTVNSEQVIKSLADIGCVAFVTSDAIVAQNYIKTYELDKACTDL